MSEYTAEENYRKWNRRLLRESRNSPIVAAGLFSMKQGASEADAIEAIIRELCNYTTALARTMINGGRFPDGPVDDHIARSIVAEKHDAYIEKKCSACGTMIMHPAKVYPMPVAVPLSDDVLREHREHAARLAETDRKDQRRQLEECGDINRP